MGRKQKPISTKKQEEWGRPVLIFGRKKLSVLVRGQIGEHCSQCVGLRKSLGQVPKVSQTCLSCMAILRAVFAGKKVLESITESTIHDTICCRSHRIWEITLRWPFETGESLTPFRAFLRRSMPARLRKKKLT